MEKIKIHITSGRGPAECKWVVSKLLKEFTKEVNTKGFATRITERSIGEFPQTLSSVTLILEGQKLDEFCNTWVGSHLWIGQSPYRKFHKRKNWFVEVYEFKILKNKTIKMEDVKIQAMRSSGPGGQHVNKTSSAVRATHIPSGLMATAQDSRSQHENKKIALEKLKMQCADQNESIISQTEMNQWKKSIHVQRGNPIRIYEGEKFKLKNLNL